MAACHFRRSSATRNLRHPMAQRQPTSPEDCSQSARLRGRRKRGCGGHTQGFPMAPEALKGALAAIYPMITCRLKQAHDIAAAAETCAASGNNEGAHRILL